MCGLDNDIYCTQTSSKKLFRKAVKIKIKIKIKKGGEEQGRKREWG